MNTILEVQDLLVRVHTSVLVEVPHLRLEQGEILAVMGPNGSGKSTLLQVLGFLRRPTAGKVLFSGRPVDFRRDGPAARRRIAMVFQEPLLCRGSVFANVAMGLRFRKLPKAVVTAEVNQWLSRLGILHLADRPAGTLSGGEAQRTSLARALVLKPAVLLLDEPFSALDPQIKEALITDLYEILRREELSTIFVTHDHSEALRLGDRIAVMGHGRILQADTPERVFSMPANEEVALFTGVETILPGMIAEQKDGLTVVDVQGKKLEVATHVPQGEKVLLTLRPEEVTLMGPNQTRAGTARNLFPGVVQKIIPSGFHFRVVIDCGFEVVAFVTRQSRNEMDLREGDRVTAAFKASAIHVIPR
ncbi:MAG: ABC transporter ATP-binding protein [Syntrophothermus sp.]